MKLTYWIAQDLDESCDIEDLIHIRAASRKDCKGQVEALGGDSYAKPRKVEVEYANGFDLLDQALAGRDLAYFEKEEEE